MTDQEFNEAIELLFKNNSMAYEEGFQLLIGHINEHTNQLISLITTETIPEKRAKLVEVLGYGNSDEIISVLESELGSRHRHVRFWAHNALLYSEHPTANKIAAKYQKEHPNEDWY